MHFVHVDYCSVIVVNIIRIQVVYWRLIIQWEIQLKSGLSPLKYAQKQQTVQRICWMTISITSLGVTQRTVPNITRVVLMVLWLCVHVVLDKCLIPAKANARLLESVKGHVLLPLSRVLPQLSRQLQLFSQVPPHHALQTPLIVASIQRITSCQT